MSRGFSKSYKELTTKSRNPLLHLSQVPSQGKVLFSYIIPLPLDLSILDILGITHLIHIMIHED